MSDGVEGTDSLYSIVDDPGGMVSGDNVPFYGGAKPASNVGYIQRRTSNAGGSSGGSESIAGQLWSVDLNGTIDFDDYHSLGVFMRVDTTDTDSNLTVLIGLRTRNEFGGIDTRTYQASGWDSADWRWIEIPSNHWDNLGVALPPTFHAIGVTR